MKITGIILISLGFIICVLNPIYGLLIGGPIYVFGLVLMWLIKASKRTKTMWSLIPLVLWLPSFIFLHMVFARISKKNAQKIDYYVNHDFNGILRIVESTCGKDPRIEDGRLQFKIPANGVYLFNGKLKFGQVNTRIFKMTKDDQIVEVKDNIKQMKPEDKDTVGEERIIGFWVGATGARYGWSYGNDSYTYTSVHIETNKAYSENDYRIITSSRAKVIDSLLQNCKEETKPNE